MSKCEDVVKKIVLNGKAWLKGYGAGRAGEPIGPNHTHDYRMGYETGRRDREREMQS